MENCKNTVLVNTEVLYTKPSVSVHQQIKSCMTKPLEIFKATLNRIQKINACHAVELSTCSWNILSCRDPAGNTDVIPS